MPHNISADGVIKPHFLTADVKTSIVEEKLTVATQMAPAVVRLVHGHNYRHPTSAKADPSPPAASQGFLGRSNVESRKTLVRALKPLVETLRGLIGGHNRYLYVTALE